MERTGVYEGLYFVLGGTVPLLNTKGTEKLRAGALKATVEARLENGLEEVILGFSVNLMVKTPPLCRINTRPILEQSETKLSHLGRGLSTGSELEYADAETLKMRLKIGIDWIR